MKLTRFRFRIVEMILAPTALVLVDGMMHIVEGRPFMNEFLAGGMTAVVLIRAMDAMRAAQNRWPEFDPETRR